MTQAEYQALLDLLKRFQDDELDRLNSRPRGEIYLFFVNQELLAPLSQIIALLVVRLDQTKLVDCKLTNYGQENQP